MSDNNNNNNPNTGDNNTPNTGGNNNQNGGNNNQNGGNNNQNGGNNNQNGGGNNNQNGGGNNNNNNNNNQNGGNNNQNGNNNASARPTAAPSATGNGGNSTNTNSTSTSYSIDKQAPPGGVQMIQPASSSTSYYPIASYNYITFKWNMTSLIVPPKSLTVRAFCPTANWYYPVGPLPTGGNLSMAGIYPGNTTEVVWNPYEWSQQGGQPPFQAAKYNLQIADERGFTQRPSGGYLSPYMDKTDFFMYFPQPYTPMANWTCSTCSGRLSMDSPATLPVLMSILIVIFSAWGLLRRDFD